jgi:pyruvate/2-oxoglutarate dehydrogenase complex dihydrolipoamide dehydrogenase (E3) component
MGPKERGKVAGAGRGRVAGAVTFSKDVIDIADHGWIPFVTFSDPQVAAAGLKAAQAREKEIDVREAWLPVVRGYLL